MIRSEPTWEVIDEPVIVAGAGENMWAELAEAFDRHDRHHLIGLNYVCEHLDVDHIVTAHANMLHLIVSQAINPNAIIHHCAAARSQPSHPVDYTWHGIETGGSAGLLGAKIARLMTRGPVILCGVPLTKTPYVRGYRTVNANFTELNEDEPDYEKAKAGHIMDVWRIQWRNAKKDGLLDGVTSMSGWTKELLG